MSTIFRSPFNVSPDPGETNSHDMVTEPGQAFTTREIYERYIRTGRVEGMGRRVIYDEDELNREPTFEDYDPTQRGDFDLSDVTDARKNLEGQAIRRADIARTVNLYDRGRISYDEFKTSLNEIDPYTARVILEHYGDKEKKLDTAKPKETS